MSIEWYVYVLHCSDGSYYTGVSKDVKRRIEEHNESKRGAKYTRSRRPVNLHFCSGTFTRSLACKLESKIKKLSNKSKAELSTNDDVFTTILTGFNRQFFDS